MNTSNVVNFVSKSTGKEPAKVSQLERKRSGKRKTSPPRKEGAKAKNTNKDFVKTAHVVQHVKEIVRKLNVPVPVGGDIARRGRRHTVNREPRPASEIAPTRAGTNQAIMLELLHGGITIPAATHHLNKATGKKLSEDVVYSTMLYDICQLKGYGVQVILMNAEQLFRGGFVLEAAALGFKPPKDVDAHDREAVAAYRKSLGDKYNPELKLPVYFLVMPKGMKEPYIVQKGE